MGNLPINPNTAALHDFTPGPHSGLGADPESQVASDSIESRAPQSVRSRLSGLGTVASRPLSA
jgi:hypothetical protein